MAVQQTNNTKSSPPVLILHMHIRAELHRKVKQAAAKANQTMRQYVESALSAKVQHG